MKNIKLTILGLIILVLASACNNEAHKKNNQSVKNYFHYDLAGEVTPTSIILQTRVCAGDSLINDDLPGKEAVVCFEISETDNFSNAQKTTPQKAVALHDFIVKEKINDLKPATTYYYRVYCGKDTNNLKAGKTHLFKTIGDKNSEELVSFVMVTGMHHYRFLLGGSGGGKKKDVAKPASPEEAKLGFPGYDAIRALKPDFWIGNGDNVYYDHYYNEKAAENIADMRAHWHRLFSMPRFRNLLSQTATYWMMDDHDYRYDDADTTSTDKYEKKRPYPSHKLGKALFFEQAPMVDTTNKNDLPYRTYRINKNLQIWMVENRLYRTPSLAPDDENKSIWGKKQKEWLKKTLLESDALYKILVTPTPMIGPDGDGKIDNHANKGGYMTEANEFFSWLNENNLLKKNFYIICGDRHWQYHSIHPSGVEEFSCGALVDANSRLGVKPGDPKSGDPNGEIKQPYTSSEPSGGFLNVSLKNDNEKGIFLKFDYYDEKGKLLYEISKFPYQE